MFLRSVGHALRVRRLSLLAALLFCAVIPSTADARPAFRDTVLSASGARALQASAEWGGPTVATDGETVKIFFSNSYPVDPARALQWADFMTSLVHGPEFATVTIHLAPLAEVQQLCRSSLALACYNPPASTIVAPADDPEPGTSAKGVLTHEYGHHVAASRVNPPFVAVDWGTKRWASYEDVCARASSGDLFPGAEDADRYMLNPGEAFAESYRVLNEQKLGLPLEPWDIVTRSLYPDATALNLLEQDILTPWTADTTQKLTAKLSAKVRSHTFKVSAPYDGTLIVLPGQTGRASVTASLLAKGKIVQAKTFQHPKATSFSTKVCGQRQYHVRVQLAGVVAKTARTTVTLTVSTP
jgi:hypothetical protein